MLIEELVTSSLSNVSGSGIIEENIIEDSEHPIHMQRESDCLSYCATGQVYSLQTWILNNRGNRPLIANQPVTIL